MTPEAFLFHALGSNALSWLGRLRLLPEPEFAFRREIDCETVFQFVNVPPNQRWFM